jgi:hypothetical protein
VLVASVNFEGSDPLGITNRRVPLPSSYLGPLWGGPNGLGCKVP